MPNETPIFESHTKDSRIWRVDWIGDVVYRRHISHMTPRFRVSISPWQDTFPYPLSEQQIIEIQISTLLNFEVGGLWQNQQKIEAPSYTVENFTVCVEKDTARLIKAGIADNDEFVIPFDRHPYHVAHTHSWCVRTEASDGTLVVIPATELIRFYYGSSSSLLARLLRYPLDTKTLWDEATLDARGYAAHVDLAKGIKGNSVEDIARIALSKRALESARMIGSSIVGGGATYPRTTFPFYGESTLHVTGMWIRNDKPRRFLVFQMRSCSHAFPFQKLTYTMASKSQASSKSGNRAAGNDLKPGISSSPLRRNISIAQEPPDKNRSAKALRIFTAVRFPDLIHKRVVRCDPENPATIFLTGYDGQAMGVPEGDGQSKVKAVDFVADLDSIELPAAFPQEAHAFCRRLREFLSSLREDGWLLAFIPLDVRQRFPYLSKMPRVVTPDGEIHPLGYIALENGTRPRYLSVVTAKLDVLSITRLFIEGDGSEEKLSEPFVIEGCGDEEVDATWVARHVANYVPPRERSTTHCFVSS